MAYFPDLSTYVYFPNSWRDTTLNVGWLSVRRPFPTKRPAAELLDRLWQYCRWSVCQARGCHRCEICNRKKRISHGPTEVTHRDQALSLGFAEIRVFGLENKIYAAPNLIFHYMVEHHYRPPDEFIEAVMDGPYPLRGAYTVRLNKLDLNWTKTWPPEDEESRSKRRCPAGAFQIAYGEAKDKPLS